MLQFKLFLIVFLIKPKPFLGYLAWEVWEQEQEKAGDQGFRITSCPHVDSVQVGVELEAKQEYCAVTASFKYGSNFRWNLIPASVMDSIHPTVFGGSWNQIHLLWHQQGRTLTLFLYLQHQTALIINRSSLFWAAWCNSEPSREKSFTAESSRLSFLLFSARVFFWPRIACWKEASRTNWTAAVLQSLSWSFLLQHRQQRGCWPQHEAEIQGMLRSAQT